VIHAAAPAVEVRDTTGAGDLFVAAYVWADLAGVDDREARLALATLYASLSCTKATGAGAAATLADLDREARRLGLPPVPRPSATKETR
jgi:sugar/nucleoside kinase (ribokinase family)